MLALQHQAQDALDKNINWFNAVNSEKHSVHLTKLKMLERYLLLGPELRKLDINPCHLLIMA